MQIKKIILTLTGIMAGTSLASAAINIDAKAYHEQRQAEKRARLAADQNQAVPALVTPAKVEQKSKTSVKVKKAEPVIEQPVVPAPKEKIEQPLAETIPAEVDAAVNAVDEQIFDTTVNAEQPAPVEPPQSL